MKNLYLFTFLLLSILSFGQKQSDYALIDQKISKIPYSSTSSTAGIADYINSNFKTDSEKIRAVFYWTASNISYDVANMFKFNAYETPQEQIAKALKTRKGVCIHYAEVFNAISNNLGIKSVIIEGYTQQFGKVASLSHAWCAAKIDNKWYIFDPTWGSGYVNKGKYVKKISDYYFKAEPNKIISSHMPFDYLWQFSNYPMTNQDFIEGKTQVNKSKKYFDFNNEISKYEALSEADKLFESSERIENNGVKNALISERLKGKKEELASLRQNSNIEKLNTVVSEYNEAILGLNDFISYRNNKFKPTLPDENIKNMIETPKEMFVKCQKDLYKIGSIGKENTSNITSLKKALADALVQTEEHVLFVQDYLSKGKLARKTMFTKLTWFGVPIN